MPNMLTGATWILLRVIVFCKDATPAGRVQPNMARSTDSNVMSSICLTEHADLDLYLLTMLYGFRHDEHILETWIRSLRQADNHASLAPCAAQASAVHSQSYVSATSCDTVDGRVVFP
jgi:hypothetical protein